MWCFEWVRISLEFPSRHRNQWEVWQALHCLGQYLLWDRNAIYTIFHHSNSLFSQYYTNHIICVVIFKPSRALRSRGLHSLASSWFIGQSIGSIYRVSLWSCCSKGEFKSLIYRFWPFMSSFKSHISQFKSHITEFKSHVTQFKSHITQFKSHLSQIESHITQFKSHISHFKSHITQF